MVPHARKHILLIEDQDATRQLIASYLRDKGYEVTECTYQSQAEPLITNRSSFDLILLDGMTDYFRDAARGARKDDGVPDAEPFIIEGRNKGIPIIAISARKDINSALFRLSDSVANGFDKSRLDEYNDCSPELSTLSGMIARALRDVERTQNATVSR